MFHHKIENSGSEVTVKLTGAFTFAASEDFRALLGKLVDLAPDRVIFDMSGVTHVDSVGLGLLFIAREELKSIALRKPRQSVTRMLELIEAASVLEVIH